MRNFRLALFTILLLHSLRIVSPAAADQSPANPTRPNIVFVLTDDQASWAVGVNNSEAKTPNMNRLFQEGAQLNNMFVVTPVCSPSRAALITSRYGSELGITDWINHSVEPGLGLDPSLPAWPRILQKAGYQTGLVGKWHLGMEDHFHPTQFGFDYFMGHRSGGWSSNDPTLEKNGKSTKFEGLNADVLGDHAVEFLKNAKKDQPFLLCWHTRAPHTRWLPVSDSDWAPYKDFAPTVPNPDYPELDTDRVKRMTREYFASVRSVDRNLGRVLATLDEQGVTDNTVVIFTSDHGYNMGHNGIWHKGNGHWVLKSPPPATKNIPKNQRPNMFDHSIRVPTAVRWPGTIAAGSKVPHTLRNIDWFPTLLDIAGVASPENAVIRGNSFLPLLKGNAIPDWDDDLYCEYSTHHQSRTHMRMMRTPEWKLVRDFLNPERDELYHLAHDPAENTNLIDSDDIVARTMMQVLDARLRETMRETETTPSKAPNGPGGVAIHPDYRKQVIAALGRAGSNAGEWRELLKSTTGDANEAASFLIAFMPDKDLRSLRGDFLKENITYALKARAELPWGESISKEIFLNDVLPYISANESRENWRRDFFEKFVPVVKDCKSPAEAAQLLNQQMFGVLKVRYSTGRRRPDQAPYESIEQGKASCTGLSILLTDACRAVGIPARLAGTPLWTNKRGNHTWVEIWDQKWHFTGACEPHPGGLNRGWFVGSASKANPDQWVHKIYATSYRTDSGTTFPFPWLIGRRGFAAKEQPATGVGAVDVTASYASPKKTSTKAANLMIQVFEEKGGKRMAVDTIVHDAAGKIVAKGKTRDQRNDTNDMLEVPVVLSQQYRISIQWPDIDGIRLSKETSVTITKKEQLLELVLQ
jgi:choline-sulfatase